MPEDRSPTLVRVLRFIRFSHTIFALPFALGSMLVAAHGFPTLRVVVLVLLCMVFARTAAMVFNRLADWEIDKRNPRTAGRHKLVVRPTANFVLAASSIAFLFFAACLNPLCMWLGPVALVMIFFYSLTKRFTAYSHFFLGLALSVAPVGAWLAVRGRFDIAPLILAASVILWVAGFDLIYATQDYEFDRDEGLHSLVVKLGIGRSLFVAQWLHWAMLVGLAAFGAAAGLGGIYFCTLALIVAAIVYEHRSAARLDLAGINQAFFWSNAFVGTVFVFGIAADLFWRG